MPFTLAHPAAILPLYAWSGARLPLAALAIGSMAPDFVYYAPFGVNGRYTHTPAGLVLFCLPAGVLAWLLFHVFLKRPLAALLPACVFRRLPVDALDGGALRCARPAPVLLALAAGALTHIAWDAMTHAHTPIVRGLPLLQSVVWAGPEYTLRLYKLLQHLSTVAGLAVLLLAAARWRRRAPVLRPADASLPPAAKPASLAAAGLLAAMESFGHAASAVADGPEHLAVRAMLGAVRGAAAPLLMFCVAWHLLDLQRRRAAAGVATAPAPPPVPTAAGSRCPRRCSKPCSAARWTPRTSHGKTSP